MPFALRPLSRFIAPALVACVLLSPLSSAQSFTGYQTETSFTGNYLAGLQAQRDGDLTKASDFLLAALAQAPDTPGLLRQAFIVTLIDGRLDDAIPLAKRFIKEDPEQSIARITIAVDLMRGGDLEGAKEELAKLDDRGLGAYAKPLLTAWAEVGLNNHDAALKALEGLDGKADNIADMHRALIHDLKGDLDAGITALIQVTERRDPTVRSTQLLGNLYERSGKPERAEAIYRLYLDGNPRSSLFEDALERIEKGKPTTERLVNTAQEGAAEGLFGLASSLGQDRVRETALALGHLGLYLRAEFPVLQYTLATILERESRPEAALIQYESINPNSSYGWPARLQAAGLLGVLERSDEAEARLRVLATEREDVADPYVYLGDMLRRQEKFEEAVLAYDEAIKRSLPVDESDGSLYYARGIVLERSQNWERAEKDLKLALELRPDDPFVLNYLGYSWIDKGENLERALAMIEKAVSKRPHDGYIIDSLGWAHYRLGNYEDAVRELERAVERRPHDPIINDHLGDAYWKVGRIREARFQWTRAVNLDPEPNLIPVIRTKLKRGLID